MIVYFSGNAENGSTPETVLNPATLMLSFPWIVKIVPAINTPQKIRFKQIQEARK